MDAISPAALERALPHLRLCMDPRCALEILDGGEALRCRPHGRVFGFHDGFLDLLGEAPRRRTLSQQALDTRLTTWLYERGRDGAMRLVGLGDFATEAARIQAALGIEAGDTVLDLACGHGNFTVEWARLAGPTGLVVGLDLSASMLRRAAARIARAGVDNVLLVRGDAHALPFASQSFPRINCSGGFHAFPDLPRALAELSRVASPGATLTASFFAGDPRRSRPCLRELCRRRLGLHFVPLPWLGRELEAAGFGRVSWSPPRAGFAYAAAVRGGRVDARN
ncbi:MAG: methyltransferase domain-containing protein [Candidatus Binatia bacterium]